MYAIYFLMTSRTPSGLAAGMNGKLLEMWESGFVLHVGIKFVKRLVLLAQG